MAMVTCGECGRAVSDKASACIGCGAPLVRAPAPPSGFNLVPQQSLTPPPTSGQLRARAVMASLTLLIGVVWSASVDRAHGSSRVAATLAALLLVAGLCWLVVTILQGVGARR